MLQAETQHQVGQLAGAEAAQQFAQRAAGAVATQQRRVGKLHQVGGQRRVAGDHAGQLFQRGARVIQQFTDADGGFRHCLLYTSRCV